MPAQPVIEEVRLTAFKSFRDAVLPVEPVTALVGRNSSGKSNALDALDVLARLASGLKIKDALEARSGDTGAVRGGLQGCVPHGDEEFALGCTVTDGQDTVRYDMRIDATGILRAERWEVSRLDSFAPPEVHHRTGLNEGNPRTSTRNKLILSAFGLMDSETLVPELRPLAIVASALRTVFPLDPVPHLMRQYVPAHDALLRRTGENLSAAIARAMERSPEAFAQLSCKVRDLLDHPVRSLDVHRTDLGDVMVALDEGPGGITPAREMSDGLLRFLAISTALAMDPKDLDLSASPSPPQPTVVVEELENGLHPTQAGTLLAELRSAAARGARTVFTTHNPVLLGDLEPSEHAGVIVCRRDPETGLSTLTRLTELPGYAEAVAAGGVGRALVLGLLDRDPPPRRDFGDFDRVMGID